MRHTKTHREMSEEGRLVEDVCKYTANGELSKTGSTALQVARWGPDGM